MVLSFNKLLYHAEILKPRWQMWHAMGYCSLALTKRKTEQDKTMSKVVLNAVKKAALSAVAIAGLTSITANAVPINITVNGGGSLLNGSGVANSSQYAALHGLSPSNNNPDRNLAFLNALIGNYNGVFDPDLPAAVGPVALDVGSISNGSYTAPAGYDYVVFHFGAGQAGGQGVSPGGWWQAWYLGGFGATFGVPSVNGKSVGGFSSARFFNAPRTQVPDGGATLFLLGASMLLMQVLRRKTASA